MVRLTRMCRTLMVMAPLSLVDLVSLLSASALPPPLPPAFLEEDLSALLLPLVSPLAGLESLDLAILGDGCLWESWVIMTAVRVRDLS